MDEQFPSTEMAVEKEEQMCNTRIPNGYDSSVRQLFQTTSIRDLSRGIKYYVCLSFREIFMKLWPHCVRYLITCRIDSHIAPVASQSYGPWIVKASNCKWASKYLIIIQSINNQTQRIGIGVCTEHPSL